MAKEKEPKEDDDVYKKLLPLFTALLHAIDNGGDVEDALAALSELRADIAISHLFDGLEVDEEEALRFLQNQNDDNLTKEDQDKRDRIIAGVLNIIDFAVCEEYHLYKEAEQTIDEVNDGELDFENDGLIEELEQLNIRYNSMYADTENYDIQYAGAVALKWIHYAETAYLTYMTQNDDRVRPWHYALQGFTARKDEFPDWMIPPIEWRCRCFLETQSGEIYAKANKLRDVKSKMPEKPSHLDGVFDESLCKCGRIFSPAHPYFMVESEDTDMLHRIVNKIRGKYNAET